MSWRKALVQCLKGLKSVKHIPADATIGKEGKLLDTLFQTGRARIHFKTVEKNETGPLVVDVDIELQRSAGITNCVCETKINNSVVIKEAALKFPFDNYKNFSGDDSTFTRKLVEAKIQENIDIVEDSIQDCDNGDVPNYCVEDCDCEGECKSDAGICVMFDGTNLPD